MSLYVFHLSLGVRCISNSCVIYFANKSLPLRIICHFYWLKIKLSLFVTMLRAYNADILRLYHNITLFYGYAPDQLMGLISFGI